MANHYTCSDGSRVTQATIDRRRSEAYRELYAGNPWPSCAGCGRPAQGTAHVVPQKRCKDIGKSEYCWIAFNMIPACHICNGMIESYKGDVSKLMCHDRILEITKEIDPERYQKMVL